MTPGCALTGPLRVVRCCGQIRPQQLTGGLLLMLPPAALVWTGNITGQAQSVVDTTDTGIAVSDLRGSNLGWNVTASATTFTNGSSTFPNTGTLSIQGSATTAGTAAVPGASCLITLSCTVPTTGAGNEPTFPVTLTTATSPTPVLAYEAQVASGQWPVASGSGLGARGSGLVGVGTGTIGTYSVTGQNPFAWWVNVSASAISGTYSSTVTMAIASLPGPRPRPPLSSRPASRTPTG